MRRLFSTFVAVALVFMFAMPVHSASRQELDAAVDRAAAFMLNTVRDPIVDSVGGEWAVIGLARSGYNVPDAFFENYFRTVERHVRERGGALHDRRLTDYSRVTLGLTAAGFDPRDVAGYDLTLPLGDFERTIWQGINGPVFALLALDSMNYAIPLNPDAQTQATRELYVAEILRRQAPDGGWNLTAGTGGAAVGPGERGNADLTGMALQALAKYQDMPSVRAATDRALAFLSGIQDEGGGFASAGFSSAGSSSVESAVQVLVALAELGIPLDDPRFVKNGNTVVGNILNYMNADGSFRHTQDGSGNNQMATEQALYGLVAAQRALDGRNSLYRMGDAARRADFAPLPTGPGLPGKNPDIRAMPVTDPGRTFADARDHGNRAAIEALAFRGIISGMTDTSFAPDATMTRAQFAAIVTRALGLPERASSPFADVPSSAWFAAPVATAFYYEIVGGTSPATFDPNGTITRQEAAVMVARAARLAGMETSRTEAETRDTLAIFGDYRSVAAWAQPAMAFCYSEGILDDYEFYIEPGKAVQRGEVAEMLYRMLDLANLIVSG